MPRVKDKEYSMDDLATIFRCTRCEATRMVQTEGIENHRRFGNTYVYERDIVKYLMDRHKEALQKDVVRRKS